MPRIKNEHLIDEALEYRELQAAEDESRLRYLATEDAKDDHRRECLTCGNGRLKRRPPCPEGDRLWDLADTRRQAWADAVAVLRSGSPEDHRHGEQGKDTDDAVQHGANPSSQG